MGTATSVRLTAEEFDALPDDSGSKLELIDGEACEMASGGRIHETVKGNLILKLAAFIEVNGINARFQSETRYHLSADEIFQPDLSIVLGNSLGAKDDNRITIIPDLAIEIVSSETAQRLQHKINVLLDLGAKAVMAVYPEDRMIFIHRSGGIERILPPGTLRLEDVLPGFALSASVIFEGL
jgi:Uma2 family endonuclease